MKVIVQQLERKLFLREAAQWSPSREGAKEFSTALEAIVFCIRYERKDIRLIGQNGSGEDVYLYPFGGDPAVKLALRKLRRSVRESRRLKAERRIVRARIDMLLAEGKEMKKQVPFKRKPGEPGPTAASEVPDEQQP